MHPYSTDSTDADNLRWICLGLGILSAIILNFVFKYFQLDLWWVDLPSVGGFYAIYFNQIDKRFWKYPSIHRFLKTPIFAGTWQGQTNSSHKGTNTKVELKIEQTLTRINVLFDAPASSGQSIAASLLLDDRGSPVLCYEFRNEPKLNAVKTMHAHRGYSRLVLKDAINIEGDYFTGRDRRTHGSILLKKTQ